jgi:hypothetical protein
MVSDGQVRLMRQKRMNGKTQAAAAASAGMSERTGRSWEGGALPSARTGRTWRTRVDPFAEVWEARLVPWLEADREGVLEARTLLDVLIDEKPGVFALGQLRTLQRRVHHWRALYGPERDVYFPQDHPPGREAAIDFTHGDSLGVTIQGEWLRHLLFEFVLSHSGWRWVAVAFGETFETLVECVQGALWELGAVPEVLRSDNLSAATHELKEGGRSLTRRFREVLEHYGMRSTRIRPGEGHENGVAEQAHYRLKSAIAQALVLRGSRDFSEVAAYEHWVRGVVERSHNRHVADALGRERSYLRPLPAAAVPNHTTMWPTVRRWSTIQVNERTYSVPSRLIGEKVEAQLHPNTVEVYYRGQLVETMPRMRGARTARIDYRHVIWSLVRKPGAFARYRFREELFPRVVFRQAYDALRRWSGERADAEYVKILHLAASTRESEVAEALAAIVAREQRFDYAAVKQIVRPERPVVPVLKLRPPDLGAYDALLAGGQS